jgi:spore coat protein U-like protein
MMNKAAVSAFVAALAGALALAGVAVVTAQPAVGIAGVSGTIVTPISVSAVTSLQFGNVVQGVPRSVSRTAVGIDTTAAVFTITGNGGSGITVQLELPEYMSNESGARLPISFSSTDCTIDSLAGTPDSPGPGAWIGINPHSLPSVKIGATSGSTSLYLGGKITPGTQQAPGNYAADIVVSVSYDGT